MLTENLMRSMDDGHLLAAARCELDPLTSTPLERELLDRFERCAPGISTVGDQMAVLDEYEVSADDLRELLEAHPASFHTCAQMLIALNDASITDLAKLKNAIALLDVLGDEDIDTPERLRAELDRLKTFNNVVADAGDTLTRLAALTQE